MTLNIYVVTNSARNSTRYAAHNEDDALDLAVEMGHVRNKAKAKVRIAGWNGQFTPTVRGTVALRIEGGAMGIDQLLARLTSNTPPPPTARTWCVYTPDQRIVEYPADA